MARYTYSTCPPNRRGMGSLVCGCIALLLPVAILAALFLFSRQQLATTPDWVYGAIVIPTLASAVVAIVLGHLSLKGPQAGAAVAGLLLGYATLLIPVVLVGQAIEGRLANTPIRTNEALATGLVPVIQIALEEYWQEKGHYPENLEELADRTAINPELLRTGRNNGYLYHYEVTPDGYRLRANPEVPGKTGRKKFDVSKRR